MKIKDTPALKDLDDAMGIYLIYLSRSAVHLSHPTQKGLRTAHNQWLTGATAGRLDLKIFCLRRLTKQKA